MENLLQVARPKFMIASLALFIIGASWAICLGAPVSLLRMLLGYLIILPAHLSVSFSNDYFDVDVDKLGTPTLFSGGSGVLVGHPKLRKPASWIAIALMLFSMALGILFLLKYSYPIWFLGIVAVSNLLGWFYSAPPLRLAYRGWGELSAAFIAGCLVPGMGYWVTMGYLNSDGLLFTIPLMLYSLVFFLTVEMPDMEMDRLGQKKTWVARQGRGFGFTAIGVLVLLATGFFFCVPYLFSHAFPLEFHLLGFFSLLPLGTGFLGMVKKPVDRKTATKFVTGMIVTLGAFFILTDGYLIFMAMH
jgi:1,4-dihydroxy-2-naphthoate polyprenyltransferase